MSNPQPVPLKLEKNLRSIVENADDAIMIKDRGGKIVFANAAMSRMLHLPVTQIVGRVEEDYFQYSNPANGQMDLAVITHNRSLTASGLYQENGLTKHIQITKHPYPTMDGNIVGIICIVQPRKVANRQTAPLKPTQSVVEDYPITQARATAVNDNVVALNRQLLGLQSATAAIAASLDLDHVIDTFTWELTDLLEADESLIFNWSDHHQALTLMPQRLSGDSNEANIVAHLNQLLVTRQVLEERRPYQLTIDKTTTRIPEKKFMQQENINVILLLPMAFQDKIIGLVLLNRRSNHFAFTEQQISLAQMLVNQAASSIANARLYQQLTQVNQELQTSNEELDAFAHSVAHDLKNPLGIVIGFSEILLSDYGNGLPDELQEIVQFIVNNTRKMHAIIDSLLMLASVRKEDVSPQPVAMSTLLVEAKTRLANMFRDANVKLIEPQEYPLVWGHGPWIEEVWVNYISNAIKYGGQPPVIEIGFDDRGDTICFWVQDNGRGLSSEQQAKLFVPFTRLNQVSVKGHGLGLSIVKRIVEKLEGSVGVESTLGMGSRFYFTLRKL